MAASIQRAARSSAGRLALAAGLILAAPWAGVPRAHEIPASVLVQAIARPEGDRFRLLLRVPLVSMRDFNFPSKPGILDTPTLDIAAVQPLLAQAADLWIVPAIGLFEDGRPLERPAVSAARVSRPSDRSFETYEQAMANFASPPLPPETDMATSAALLDVLLEYRIASDRARFSIDPRLARLGMRVVTTLRFQAPGHPERAFQFAGDPGLVHLDPRWHQAFGRFVRLGFDHILDGIDHLLFLFCLVLPLRRLWPLVGVVTAFTVAHSITLGSAAFGLIPTALWFPPLIEALIAASIVYMAIENIVVAARARGGCVIESPHGRWMLAFAFGLIHGFGFSFALQETLQFAGAHVVTSLLAFNIGVELGQLLVLVLVAPALAALFRWGVDERIGVIIASALVLHTAWHWMTERSARLGEYDWSISDPASFATVLRVLMVVVAVAGVFWALRRGRA